MTEKRLILRTHTYHTQWRMDVSDSYIHPLTKNITIQCICEDRLIASSPTYVTQCSIQNGRGGGGGAGGKRLTTTADAQTPLQRTYVVRGEVNRSIVMAAQTKCYVSNWADKSMPHKTV